MPAQRFRPTKDSTGAGWPGLKGLDSGVMRSLRYFTSRPPAA